YDSRIYVTRSLPHFSSYPILSTGSPVHSPRRDTIPIHDHPSCLSHPSDSSEGNRNLEEELQRPPRNNTRKRGDNYAPSQLWNPDDTRFRSRRSPWNLVACLKFRPMMEALYPNRMLRLREDPS